MAVGLLTQLDQQRGGARCNRAAGIADLLANRANSSRKESGAFLTMKRLVAWRIPLTILTTMAFLAALGYDQGSSSSNGSVWFHWTTGGLIASAFFVATDPVTHPSRARDQVIFGVLVAAVVYWIRSTGSYPDGIAFAIFSKRSSHRQEEGLSIIQRNGDGSLVRIEIWSCLCGVSDAVGSDTAKPLRSIG